MWPIEVALKAYCCVSSNRDNQGVKTNYLLGNTDKMSGLSCEMFYQLAKFQIHQPQYHLIPFRLITSVLANSSNSDIAFTRGTIIPPP